MAREKLQTLSEPMYYILLALLEERCGVDIMAEVEHISGGRIRVGPGTAYALLDKFLGEGMIRETKVEGRKRSYIITEHGKELLTKEYERLQSMVREGHGLIGREI
ncbi:MAG: PadR family transcriptional regulator [Bacillota bacterium]|nr:PadR family transcriptional regulator [Bacillota bacterium]